MKKQKGFTLIELLVVIAIIGLLSTLAVVALNNARSKSRDAKRLADIKSIQTALEIYLSENAANSYPVEGTAVTLGVTPDICFDEDGFVAVCDASGTTYMSTVPKNPTPAATAQTTYSYMSRSAGAACSTSPCREYYVAFALEEATANLPANTILYASSSGISTVAP